MWVSIRIVRVIKIHPLKLVPSFVMSLSLSLSLSLPLANSLPNHVERHHRTQYVDMHNSD